MYLIYVFFYTTTFKYKYSHIHKIFHCLKLLGYILEKKTFMNENILSRVTRSQLSRDFIATKCMLLLMLFFLFFLQNNHFCFNTELKEHTNTKKKDV